MVEAYATVHLKLSISMNVFTYIDLCYFMVVASSLHIDYETPRFPQLNATPHYTSNSYKNNATVSFFHRMSCKPPLSDDLAFKFY
jgi:hypothetical protein